MPCLKRCCFCVTLRTGGITMGIMTLAMSLFSIIPMAFLLANRVFWSRIITHMSNEIKAEKNTDPSTDTTLNSVNFLGVVQNVIGGNEESELYSELPPEDDKDVQSLTNIMFVFCIVCIVLLIVYLACSVGLIIGAAKGKRWWLLPWIVATFLFLLAFLGGVALSGWILGGRVEVILLLAFSLIQCAVGFYLWSCIVSLFQVLNSSEWRAAGSSGDWELRPRFSTSYNTVPTSERR